MAVPFYQSRPYSNPTRTARMSDLMRTDAAIRANTELATADASARMWQGLGNQVGDMAMRYAQSEIERPRRELREAQVADKKQTLADKKQITEVLKLTRDPETGEINLRQAAKEIAHIDPATAQEFFQAASAEEKNALLANRERLERLGQFAGGVLLDIERLAPPERPAYIRQRADAAVEMGLIRGEDIPEHLNEAQLRAAFTTTLKTTDLARMLEEQTAAPKGGSFEGFVKTLETEKGSPLSEDDLLEARRQWESAGRGPEKPRTHMVTVPGPDGRPIQRLATEEELAGGVPAYREPKGPAASEPLVAVIGDDGRPVLMPRGQAAGRTPASTREQGRPVTSGDAGRIAELDTSLDDIGVLRQTLTETAGSTGTAAKVGASLPNWATELTGWGEDAKKRQGVIDRVKQVIGKALEGGVLRKEDEAKYEKILPTIADTQAVAASKLDGLDRALQLRRERMLEALGDAGYDVSRYAAPGGAAPGPQGSIVVETPDGQRFTFPTRDAADAFKKAAGIP